MSTDRATADADGITFNGTNFVSWEEVDRLRSEQHPLSDVQVIEFGSTVTLAPNTLYKTECYHISKECIIRASPGVNGDMSPLVENAVEFAVNTNKTFWQTAAYSALPGDKVYLRFTTPFNGNAEYYLMINDFIAGKITVYIKE